MVKLLKAFRYAWQGIVYTFRTQRNFKIQLSVALLAILAGWYFRISRVEWLAICVCIGGVLSLEIINTALEELCNHLFKEQHEVARIVKDCGAAAVLLFSIASVVVGVVIFEPLIIWSVKSLKESK